jgi:PAS domain S-box-containing protein
MTTLQISNAPHQLPSHPIPAGVEGALETPDRSEREPRLRWNDPQPADHRVQFYETDAFLLETVSAFMGSGLGAGAACIVVATPAHREELAQRLRGNGLDLESVQVQGKYLALDAAETLAQFLVEGAPDPQHFARVVGAMVERTVKRHHRVRIFGEMVALLWAQGQQEAAVHLETLWDALGSTTPYELLCAYPMSLFAGSAHTDPFTRMCALHSRVIPDEGYTRLPSQQQLREVSLLRQKALSLEAEVAERQAAEERLRISENRYRRLFEAATDGILLVEPESGRITAANPALLALVGASQSQVVERELWEVGLLPDRPAQRAFLHQVRGERVLRSEVVELATATGPARQVEWVSTLFQANGHEVLQCTLRDITDRRQAEEVRLRLAAIVSSSEDAIRSQDLEGIITSWNSAAEQLYGYPAEAIVGQPVTLLFPPDRQEECTRIMERLRKGERVDHYETMRLRKDGSQVPVSVTVSPLKDHSGTIIGASAIARDISKRQELERQREAFISLVTHELKTPLTILQGHLQLAQRQLTRLLGQAAPPDEAQQRTLEELLGMLGRSQQPIRFQQRLINDLVDLARLQEDKMELHLADCDLLELVAQIVQDHQAAHPARLITLDLPEEDPLLVTADRDRLQQVLSNYLSNALKFSPDPAPVQIGITLEAGAARVWVRDHGPGLPVEQHARIWQQYYQAPTTPVQRGWKPGLGLGLYICQQLIHRQQGEVGVQSRPGAGATFWFSLPLQATAHRREHAHQGG